MRITAQGGKSGPAFEKTKKVLPAQSPASGLSLPTEKTRPVSSLSECSILIYGEKKIGKTSLASQFPSSLFLFFEPGGKGLSVYSREVSKWPDFVSYINMILADKSNRFQTIIIDTIDIAYSRCFDYICKKQAVDHPSEGTYGDVWNAIKKEFVDQIDRLLLARKGVIFISHAEVAEFQSRTFGTTQKIIPTMPKQARHLMQAVADVILYYGYYGDERWVTVSGSENLDAGHRLKHQFWVSPGPQSGKRIHSIPMGRSEEEAFANLSNAFNNQLSETGDPEGRLVLSDQRAKKQGRK